MSRAELSDFSSKRASSAPVRGDEERAGADLKRETRAAARRSEGVAAARNPESSADRRSGRERPTDPQPATTLRPCPRLGDSGPSRHVPDGGAAKSERREGCRGRFLGCREGARRATPPGPPSAPARGAAGQGRRVATAARHQRDTGAHRRGQICFGWFGGLWTESCAPSLMEAGVLGGGPPKDLRAAHLRSNPVRKNLVRNVAAERPP